MPFAPLVTHFRSFLWNHYHAVSPFELPGMGVLAFAFADGAQAYLPHRFHARCVVYTGTHVNDTLIAQGEVVVVNDRFGVRLTDVISPSERIKRLR